MSDYQMGKQNPFAGEQPALTLEEVDQTIYGVVDLQPSGRVVGNPIDIFSIWPDRKQPRRVVPAALRAEWDGTPDGVPEMLRRWNVLVENRLGLYIPATEYILGRDDVHDIEAEDGVVAGYVKLLRLAASIHRDGLLNPISVVVKRNGKYLIDTGERRWLAHHLLVAQSFDKFRNIPARVVDEPDVWRQAAENGQREDLNAIAKARMLALLIMDMYEHDDGATWTAYEDMVLPGECDRRFYAQVSDGNIWRIKRGYTQRVLAATGLKTRVAISYYRGLLSIPDDLWMEADEENLSVVDIRAMVDPTAAITPKKENGQRDMLTPVNISPPSTRIVKHDSGVFTAARTTAASPENQDEYPAFTPKMQPLADNHNQARSPRQYVPDEPSERELSELYNEPIQQYGASHNPLIAEFVEGDDLWMALMFLSQWAEEHDDGDELTTCRQLFSLSEANSDEADEDLFERMRVLAEYMGNVAVDVQIILDRFAQALRERIR